MGKNIIYCADGTWNGPEATTGVSTTDGADSAGELDDAAVTNVVKLFANFSGSATPETLALHNEQEKTLVGAGGKIVQVAKYMHGVGDSRNVILKVLGGLFGMGVIARIVRGYTFISRNYVAGDDIYIAGFSRGAYTARALAGMITAVGLLDPRKFSPDDTEKAYRLGIAAWAKAKGVKLQGTNKFTDLANHLLGLVEHLIADTLPEGILIPDIRIKAVAVWDTVGSMGIPVYAGDQRFDVFRFTDTALSAQVENGFHAMAIDEQRRDFPVTRWNGRTGVRQVWFAGAHADVGGGYAPSESRLSDVALDWMTRRLTEAGVNFSAPPAYVPDTKSDAQPVHEPWNQPPFNLMPRAPREPEVNDVFHRSVVQRWKADARYRPPALGRLAALNVDKLNLDA
jgi:uncharacterized protein (DUF2235 family)